MVGHGKNNMELNTMIDEELRQKIEKNIPNHITLEELQKEGVDGFDIFFKECYKMVENGHDFVVLYPWCDKVPSLVFDMENGDFAGIEDIQFAREYGELL